MVADPAALPVTFPFWSTVIIAVLLDVQLTALLEAVFGAIATANWDVCPTATLRFPVMAIPITSTELPGLPSVIGRQPESTRNGTVIMAKVKNTMVKLYFFFMMYLHGCIQKYTQAEPWTHSDLIDLFGSSSETVYRNNLIKSTNSQ
jgi:hypothetical protein